MSTHPHIPPASLQAADPILSLSGVHRTYHMGTEAVHALAGVDLTVQLGEFMSIMGRSGSGKSTLLNVIGCLDRPTRGRILLGGTDVTRLSEADLPRLRRQRIGFIFQQFNLIPTLTALENVELPMKYAGLGAGERRHRALVALQEVGLADRAGHRPAELSGGQQQRVAIARGIAPRPAVILADEPTGALDSATSASVIALLRRLNEERGQTVIIVTHDPGVSRETDRIVRLLDGRVESDERASRYVAAACPTPLSRGSLS